MNTNGNIKSPLNGAILCFIPLYFSKNPNGEYMGD